MNCFSEEPRAEFALQMARVDHHLRRQEFAQALGELGQVPKEHQNDPLFRRYSDRALAALHGSQARRQARAAPAPQDRLAHRTRVTRRKSDADARSDQSFDNRGWHVSDHWDAETRVWEKHGIRGRFTVDTEGFRNGHNDVRYRTLLADLTHGNSHLALGDHASFPSLYFLRGSRLRGVDLLLEAGDHEFQALFGGYPFWLEAEDQYIYPRTVWGLRDRVTLWEDRLRFAGAVSQTRDSEKIRTISTANQPRDNVVVSLDQEIKLIPDVWWVKASEAYGWTDDNLIENRFGDTTKLKDPSFTVESRMIQPWVRWNSFYQRVGPDFRLLTDIPSGSVVNSKGLTSDRELIEQRFDFNPWGPLDLDLEASWMRNDLDDDSTIEHTRQRWTTANLGWLVPRGWPRPRLRATLIDTVSIPGSTTRPSQVRTLDLRQELSHTFEGIHWTGFGEYQVEHPLKDEGAFDEEERWALGTRMATTLMERLGVSPSYKYAHVDEVFNEIRRRGIRHEAGLSSSLRLWSTASLGLSYLFTHGKWVSPAGTDLTHLEGHAGTATFTWPYTLYSENRRRKWVASPSLTLHVTDLNDKLEQRPLLATRLTAGYEAFRDWKVELMGEFRYDDDKDGDRIRSEESRLWLLWTSQWK